MNYTQPEVFYKIGYTSASDAEQRFTQEWHDGDARNGKHPFANTCFEQDYDYDTIWGCNVSLKEAQDIEKRWKEKYKRNFWTETFYNGITECRLLTDQQVKELRTKLYAWKSRRDANKSYPANAIYRVYFMKFTKRINNESNGDN